MAADEKKIATLDESPWAEWLRCSETQLYHYFEPAQGLFIAESLNVIARAIAAGYTPISFLIDTAFYTASVQQLVSQFPEIPVYLAETSVLNSVTGLHLTRGVLCAMRRHAAYFDAEMLSGKSRIVLLENVMNPTNLGAIFRSAAALGMDAILLTSGCTDPLYRRAARVSMGTVFQIPWAYLPDAPNAANSIQMLRGFGFRSVAMALSEDSLAVDDPELKAVEKQLIVLGTEGEGLALETIAACDWTVRIPMLHGVDSLNVAAASAVAFWELRKRNQ